MSTHPQLTQDGLLNLLEPMNDQKLLAMTAMDIMLIVILHAAIDPEIVLQPEIVHLKQNLLLVAVLR